LAGQIIALKKQLLLSLLVISLYTSAQQVNFIKYTVYDGLVSNPVRCIFQDSKGFIWIGTFEGLSRYDGYKFTNYTTANGLSHNFVNFIMETNGKLLIAENNGAIDVIKNSTLQKGLIAASAVNFIMPSDGRLLITTDLNGFYEYKNDTIFLPGQEKTNSPLGHLIPLNDSLLLSDGVDNNLFLYKKDLTIYSSLRNLHANFHALFRDSKNRIWACTSGGLKLLKIIPEKKHLSIAPLPPKFNFFPLTNAQVISMVEEKDGSFWIGTMKGLVRLFPNGSFQVYNEKDGLPSAIIYTLYHDKENNLWIGTALGLAKWVAKNNVVFYNTENKDFKNDVSSISLSETKNIILRTGHGLQSLDVYTKEFKNITAAANTNYVPISGTSPMLVYYTGTIGMLDSARNKIIPVEKLDSALQGVISSAKHSNGTIFMGTFDGLFAIKRSRIKKILPDRITGMVLGRDGKIWAGTWGSGIFRIAIQNNAEPVYDIVDVTSTIGNKQIRGLFEDSKHNIWVGTRYNGAFCVTPVSNGKFDIRHFNRQSGLMSDWVNSFAETTTGDMWVGTYLGLDKLVKESDGYRIFNFSKAVNFFAEIKNIVSTGDNDWVCVANTGIAYFKDENIHQTAPLQANILSTTLGLLEDRLTILSPKDRISLKPHQNTARFVFSALGYYNEKQIMYRYRLTGAGDTTWSKPENIHEASYASLTPGHYTFEVKTIGWNGEDGIPATFSFFITTPFWKQWWFIGSGILAIAIFFYALYRYRIQQLLRLQTVRNNIAANLHDDIGSSLTNISILSELSYKNISQPEKAQPFLKRISEEVQASNQAMDDIIWSVNSRNDSLQETIARMRRYAAELFDNSETNCHLQLDENAGNKKLSMEQRKDVYLIYKEVLTNIHKHAHANNVWIEVAQNQNHLLIQINDDGKGFNTNSVTHRNGLKNLRSRVEKWNGTIQIRSEENKGVDIEIKIALKD